MIEIIIYSTVDGIIAKSVTCKPEDAPLQCTVDQAWMEHAPVDDSLYKVDLNTLDIVPI